MSSEASRDAVGAWRRPRTNGSAVTRGAVLLTLLVALAAVPTVDLQAQATVRVAAYNIRHGRGMDGRVDLERIADVLRALDADVVTLQEVDDGTERTGGVDQAGVLAELLGYRGIHGPHRPYQGGLYGNAVLTRLPVGDVVVHAIPPASGSALSVLEVEVRTEDGPSVSVVSVHLAGTIEERLAQAEAVTGFFREHRHPVVLAGDFNGRPDGPVLERLGLDWGVARKSDPPETYPSDGPDREIDFLMVRRSDRVEVLEHRVVPEPMASDHRPIVAALRIESPEGSP